jgi:hypothetical protein
MKNLKYIFLLLSFGFIFQSAISNAQSENTNQIGIRLGGFSGISFRHFGNQGVGVEADLTAGYHSDWVMLEVLAEKQIALGDGFTFDFGGGGFFANDHDYPHNEDPYDWRPTVGIEGMIGFDYYFNDVPLNVGLDLRPRFSLIEEPYWPWDAGISLHYIF